jgi:DNA-binding beta-propeller fold protein YncE
VNPPVIVKNRGLITFLTLAIIMISLCGVANARQMGIFFDEDLKFFVPSQIGYVPHREFGLKLKLKNASDLFIDSQDNLWIADTGNHRILKTDLYGNLLLVIGGEGKLKSPEGVFVTDDGYIYVADTKNHRIVKYNPDGTVNQIYNQPESSLFPSNFTYEPTKIIVDLRGHMFVVNSQDYRGLMEISPLGNFVGYFASYKVSFSLRKLLIDLFATEAQKAKYERERDFPMPHTNIFLDPSGYIYSSSIYAKDQRIKKINTVGKNVFPDEKFGWDKKSDEKSTLTWGWEKQQVSETGVAARIIDVTVDNRGIVSGIDQRHCLVYQYDQNGNLLLMFGGQGPERGKFGNPVSIEIDSQGYLYVLDSGRNNIQVFRSTQFANLVHEASALYTDGRYEDAAIPYNEILKYNSNYKLAHIGIAKAYLKMDMYDEAMHHYRLAGDREGYSQAFGGIRYDFAHQSFEWILVGIVVVGLLIYLIFKFFGWVLKQDYDKSNRLIKGMQLLLRVMREPSEAFYEIKYQKRGDIGSALTIMLLVFAVRIFNIQLMSFQVHRVYPEQVSLLTELLRFIGIWVLYGIANYAITAIFEGEGKFSKILISTAYCFGPYLFFSWWATLISHVLLNTERGYLDLFNAFIWYYVIGLVFIGMKNLHDFSLVKNIGMTFATIFGIMVMLGVGGLSYAMTDQMINFVREVIMEIMALTT